MTLRARSGEREPAASPADDGEAAASRSCGARLAWRTRRGRPFSVSPSDGPDELYELGGSARSGASLTVVTESGGGS